MGSNMDLRDRSKLNPSKHDPTLDGLWWKDDKIFSGDITSYPVELFISVIENEARSLKDSEEEMCHNAWSRIAEGKNIPSGIWKTKMQDKYNDASSFHWNDLKKDLLEEFGRTDFAYTFEEKFDFLLSLTRGEREGLTAYLSRVEWVMSNPLAYNAGDTAWIKMLFLLGLQEEDQLFFLDQICSNECKKLNDVVRDTLKDKTFVSTVSAPKVKGVKVKQEYAEEEELYDPGFLEVDFEPEDDFEDTKPLVTRKRKSKVNGKGGPVTKKKRGPKKGPKLRGCITCDLDRTMNKEQWDDHEAKTHLGKCDLCELSFDNLEGMRRHHKERHKGNSAMCSKCNLPQKRYLLPTHHSPCKFELCKKEEGLEPSFLGDSQRTPGKPRERLTDRPTMKTREHLHQYTLKEGEDPMTFRTFTSHLVKVESNGESRWFCSYCHKEFSSRRLLNKHSIDVHEAKKYYCDICPDNEKLRWKQLDFLAVHKLRKHNVVVESYEIIQCSKCTFQDVRECNMKDHMRKKHPEDATDLQCKICNKNFSNMQSLRLHIETQHMKVFRYQCEECEQKFPTSLARKTHMLEHHGPDLPGSKNYVCSICGTRLRNEITLKAHIKLSHEMPEETCKVCEKKFKNKYALKTHVEIAHIKEKRFKCTLCPDSAFHQKKILYDHCMYHHVKIKPFVCAVCNHEYWQKPIMGAHIAEQHEGWPKDKAKAEWKYLLREKPHLWRQIPITAQIKQALGENQ